MESNRNKRSTSWVQPLIVVGAILVAIGVASAVSGSNVTTGASIVTVGDTLGAGFVNIYSDSSVDGIALFGTNSVGALGVVNLRHAAGSVNSSGVHTGTVGASQDATNGSLSITFGGMDTGSGSFTWSAQSISANAGETTVQAVMLTNVVAESTTSNPNFLNFMIGDTGFATMTSGSANFSYFRNTVGGESGIIWGLRGQGPGEIVGGGDSLHIAAVYNAALDTFVGVPKTALAGDSRSGGSETFIFNVRIETGVNYIYLLAMLNGAESSVTALRDSGYHISDSIAFRRLVVVVVDTSAGGTATGNPATAPVVASGASTTLNDTVAMSVSGSVTPAPITLTVTPVSATSAQVITADSTTSGETHTNDIYDFMAFNSAGGQILNLSPGSAIITIEVGGSDTVAVVTNGMRLIRLSTVTGAWENMSNVIVTPLPSSSDVKSVRLTTVVTALSGDVIGVGLVSGAASSSGGGGGTCVMDRVLGGTPFAASFGMVRSIRDFALSTSFGRSLVAFYYAAGALLALGLLGLVARKARRS